MKTFTDDQLCGAKVYLQSAYEYALLAFRTRDELRKEIYAAEMLEQFKRAATEIGFLVEDGAVPDEQRPEVGEGDGSNPASDPPKPILPFLRGI